LGSVTQEHPAYTPVLGIAASLFTFEWVLLHRAYAYCNIYCTEIADEPVVNPRNVIFQIEGYSCDAKYVCSSMNL